MKLTYGAISFSLTDDAEREAESRMINSNQNLSADILKVGHHDSDTSTPTGSKTSGCIDINKASATELEGTIHIGPARATDIIEARSFQSVDDLTGVKGIAEVRLTDIKAEGKACLK